MSASSISHNDLDPTPAGCSRPGVSSASSAFPLSDFDSMIAPSVLEYLKSRPELGIRSYTWAAREHSLEAYRAWLRNRVFQIFADDKYGNQDYVIYRIALMAFLPCFGSLGEALHRFDGRCWVESNQAEAEAFLQQEIGDFLVQIYPDVVHILPIVTVKVFASELQIEPRFHGLVTPKGTLFLEDGAYVVKPSMPDDYHFTSTDVCLEGDFSYETPQVKEVLTWLNQIFRDTFTVIEFLNHLRGALTGRPGRAVWCGHGNNSKYCMWRMVGSVFGRFIRANEEDEEVYESHLDVSYMNPQADIFITNEDPARFTHCEKYHFVGIWSEQPDPENGVYLLDPHFMAHAATLAPAFLWILTRVDILSHLG